MTPLTLVRSGLRPNALALTSGAARDRIGSRETSRRRRVQRRVRLLVTHEHPTNTHPNLERPQRSPPPKLFPHKLETFMASLSPRQAQETRASTDSVFWDDVPVWNG